MSKTREDILEQITMVQKNFEECRKDCPGVASVDIFGVRLSKELFMELFDEWRAWPRVYDNKHTWELSAQHNGVKLFTVTATGKWNLGNEFTSTAKCPMCGCVEKTRNPYKYCPNCGTKMEGWK